MSFLERNFFSQLTSLGYCIVSAHVVGVQVYGGGVLLGAGGALHLPLVEVLVQRIDHRAHARDRALRARHRLGAQVLADKVHRVSLARGKYLGQCFFIIPLSQKNYYYVMKFLKKGLGGLLEICYPTLHFLTTQ